MFYRRFIYPIIVLCLFFWGSFGLLASEVHSLDFAIGKYTVDSTYKNNTRASARIREAIESASNRQITVTAYSSPDGKLSRNRQLARLRANSVLSFFSHEETSVNVVIVPEDWEGVRKYLRRSNLEWKDEALAILSSNNADTKALLQDLWVGEAWDDLMKNCFPSLRRVCITVAENASTEASDHDSGASELIFDAGSSAIKPGLPGNTSALSKLKDLASSGCNTLYVYIKASPEGEEAANQRLSMKRAQRIKDKLYSLGYTGAVATVYEGEDWEGLATKVKESSDLPDKEAVLDILNDSSFDRESRKHALQALSYGKTWLRLMDEEMSGLRKAIITPDRH